MQNQIYTNSITTRAYVQSPSNPLEISTILVKSFTSNEPQRTFLLCVQWLQPRSYSHFLQWIPRNVGPLCLVITTKKLYPLFAMNPKDVGLLCPVINQETNPVSCNEPKERWSLVFSVSNQEDLPLKTITMSRSLEKFFCKNGGEEENRIAQVFVQWTFLDKVMCHYFLLFLNPFCYHFNY